MNKEELAWIEQQEAALRAQQANVEATQTNQVHLQQALQQQETSMVREQLDLTEELETIRHLLKGEVLIQDEKGNINWTPPLDKDMVILSDYGIHLMMNTITFYINKNTLLSNYDEDTINQKMEDFASDLSSTIFMEYEKVFQQPSFEECRDKLNARLDRKAQLRKFALELTGQQADEKEIRTQMIDELEGRIEKEIDKIREQTMKNKLKRFLILIREVQDAVHSTYLRALAGAERRTLRQHIHISETKGGNQFNGNNRSNFNPMNWLRKS